MDESAYLRLIRGETPGVAAHAGRIGLSVASLGYRLAVNFRNLGFDRGWLESHAVATPVVAVGNLTTGGTGKTPMVEWVARWYRERGVRVAILSRGYRKDGEGGVNDEALVLEENLPDVPHLQDPDRVAIARVAVEELESELLVLDDGFQHRRLSRDLDIVLLDALDPFGLGRLLPRGLLREPLTSLKRAGVVVITRSDLVSPEVCQNLREEAERRAGKLRWVTTRHAPVEIICQGASPEPVETLRCKKVAAFCGIGNPEGFRRTTELLCGLRGFRTFPDHHGYTAADVAVLTEWVRSLDVDLALTTQKDLVKLRAASLGGVPLRALRVGLEVIEGSDLLESALAEHLPTGLRK